MGLFSSKTAQEPSYSRAWLAQHGPISRKNEIAFAIVNRIAAEPVGTAAAWGTLLDRDSLEVGRTVARTALVQDHSLAGRVARDTTLLFESLGGLAVNRSAALESVGLDDSIALVDESPSASPLEKVAAESLAIARTLQARSQGGEGLPRDVALYSQLHEDQSTGGYELALNIASWTGIVVARLHTSGRLGMDGAMIFEPRFSSIGRMEGVGWYPNPINAGDISSAGEPELERWWDGNDWTQRLRVRDGRRWEERLASMFVTPNN